MIAIAFALEFESAFFRARHDSRLRVAVWLLGTMGAGAAASLLRWQQAWSVDGMAKPLRLVLQRDRHAVLAGWRERTLVAVSNPMATLELDEVRRALAMLPDDQREALILIGAGGLSYEEVADICGSAIGTIKSRVSRARADLQRLVDGETPEPAADA